MWDVCCFEHCDYCFESLSRHGLISASFVFALTSVGGFTAGRVTLWVSAACGDIETDRQTAVSHVVRVTKLCSNFMFVISLICKKEGLKFRETQQMKITYFIMATCFDPIRSSSGHCYKTPKCMLRIVLDGIISGEFSYLDTVARIVLKWSWAHYTFLAVPVAARSEAWFCGC